MPFGGRGWSEPPLLKKVPRAPLAERNYDALGDEAIPSSPFGNMNAALREKNRGRTEAAVDLEEEEEEEENDENDENDCVVSFERRRRRTLRHLTPEGDGLYYEQVLSIAAMPN